MATHASLFRRVEDALDEIRPYLSEDLGGVEVVSVTQNGEVHIKWLGNCEHCKMSDMTLKAGIERTLRKNIPEVTAVIPVN